MAAKEKMIQINIPKGAAEVIRVLEAHGYEAYIVGGCVRDACLGRVPSDWDITTSALPGEIEAVFSHTVPTGEAHGTITVLMGQESYEVTTYRIDGEYLDSRHPREVTFTRSLSEDLRRRDFTINAMAYNESKGLIDLFDGQKDLERKVIRCVGEARERFAEDALRMMRAVRFGAQLGFAIDPPTAQAIRELAGSLKKISAERIRTEIEKLLVSAHPGDMRIMYQLGITAVVFPEFDRMMQQAQNSAHHHVSVGEHTLMSLEMVPADKVLRLCMLLHDLGKCSTAKTGEDGTISFPGHAGQSEKMARSILRRWKYDNETVRHVTRLVGHHSDSPAQNEPDLRRQIYEIGEDLFERYLWVRVADVSAQSGDDRQLRLEQIEKTRELYQTILRRGDCLSLRSLAVSGADLLADGMPSGAEMGKVLHELLMDVLEYPEHNTKACLLEKSRQLREKSKKD